MKKTNIKKKIIGAVSFVITVFTVLSAALYYKTDFVDVKEMNFENNSLSVTWEEMTGVDEYLVEVSESLLFFDSMKENVKGKHIFIEGIAQEFCYVRIKPSRQSLTHFFSKTYKLENHKHNNVFLKELSVYPLCDKEGHNIYKCEKCDNVRYEVVGCRGHEFFISNISVPSCYRKGYTRYTCFHCNLTNEIEMEKTEHFLEYVGVLEKSTCIKKGTGLYKCNVCSAEKTELMDYANHNYVYNGDGVNSGAVYLSKKCTVCGKTTTKDYAMHSLGSYCGLLHIPSFDITVPVYVGPVGGTQAVCDAPNSASFQLYSSDRKTIIADHYYQGGFTNIRYAVVGQTIMYYKGEKYICTENVNGYHCKTYIGYENHADIADGGSELYLYTCNDKYGISVRIVGWSRI